MCSSSPVILHKYEVICEFVLQGFADEELNKQVTALCNKEAIKNSL